MAQPVTNLCPQLQLDSQSQAESKTISNNLRQETHASHSPLNTPPFEHRTEGTASQQEAGSQQPQAQGPLANQLLFCGAGLPNAYLAVTFDQLVLLSKGRAVDLVQRAAPCKGSRSLLQLTGQCYAQCMINQLLSARRSFVLDSDV